MNETFNATGKVKLVLRDEFGNIKDERDINNLIVQGGKNHIAYRMAGTSVAVNSHIAVGTSGTAPGNLDMSLGTEIFRKAVTVAGGTPSVNTVTYAVTLVAGEGTGTLQEAGIFNDPTVGVMTARTTFTSIVKGAGDSLAITWTITIN